LLTLYKNGVEISVGTRRNSTQAADSFTLVDTVLCNAGDYLEAYLYSTNAVGLQTGGSTWINYMTVIPLQSSSATLATVPPSRAYRTAAFTAGSSAWLKIPLDTIDYDPANNFDVITNGRYNCPVSGRYLVLGGVLHNLHGTGTAQKDALAAVYKNGTAVTHGGFSMNLSVWDTAGAASVCDVVSCAAGDYLELWGYFDSGDILTIGAGGFWGPTASDTFMTVVPLSGTNYATPTQPGYQNGVMNSPDAVVSAISLNTATGALTFTTAAANPIWVKNASGLVTPVSVIAVAQTLTPGALPATTNYAIYGVEIDTNGTFYLVKGTDTVTQLNTGLLIAANSPAVTSGRIRIADFSLRNVTGTINFGDATTVASQGVNWIDRRPWARGAYSRVEKTGGNYTTASTTSVLIDSTLPMRIECTGVPVRMSLRARMNLPAPSGDLVVNPMMDGAVAEVGMTGVFAMSGSGNDVVPAISWDLTPTARSHLFTWFWNVTAGTGTILAGAGNPLLFTVEEITEINANNGTA
jgi:hypothetical protein